MEGQHYWGVAVKDEPLDTGDYGHMMRETQNQESSSIAVRKSRRQSAMVSQFENKSRPKKQLSGRIMELDELLLLTGKQLVQLFSEVTANSLNKSFEYSCCMMPDTCSTTYKSFGNEDKARSSIMNHLVKHMEELSEKKRSDHTFKFSAQTVSNVHAKSASTVKKRGKSIQGKTRGHDDEAIHDHNISRNGPNSGRPPETSDVVIKVENVKTEPLDQQEYGMPMDQTPTLEVIDLRCVKVEQNQILDVVDCCQPMQVSEQDGIAKEKENIAPKRRARKSKAQTTPCNGSFEANTASHSHKTPNEEELVSAVSTLSIEGEIFYLDETDIGCEVEVEILFSNLSIYDEAYSTSRKRRYNDDDDDADWGSETTTFRSYGRSGKNSKNDLSLTLTPGLYDEEDPAQTDDPSPPPSTPKIHLCNSSCVDHLYHRRLAGSSSDGQNGTNLQSEGFQECEMSLEDDVECSEQPNRKPEKLLFAVVPYDRPNRLVIPIIKVPTADIDLALINNDPYEWFVDDEEAPVERRSSENPPTQAGQDEKSIELISDEKADEIVKTNVNQWSQKDMQEMVMYYIGQIKSRKVTNCLVCQICNKRVTATATLVHHYKSHAGLKSFSCHLCDMQFTRQHSLNYHLSIHENKTRFTCSYCNRGFRHPSHYKEHLRKHTGETPFQCPDCGLKFKTSNTYKRHMKTQHNKKVPPVRPNQVKVPASDSASEGQESEVQHLSQSLAQDTSNSSSTSISPFQPLEGNSVNAENEALDLRVQSRKPIDDEAALPVLPRSTGTSFFSKTLLHPRFLKRLQSSGADVQDEASNARR